MLTPNIRSIFAQGVSRPGSMTLYFPSRDDVRNLKVGDLAPDCFGNIKPVLSITFAGDDIHGKAYVGYYTQLVNGDGKVSMSIKEDEIVSTVRASDLFTSAELQAIQFRARKGEGILPRE